MKPSGTIPADFPVIPALRIGGVEPEHWAAIAGDTPLFVYDRDIVASRVARFRAAMPGGVQLHYAVKANPFAPLLDAIAPLVDGFDVASAAELAHALAVKPATAISIAGPGKRDRELAAAVEAGATINLESATEATRAIEIATRQGRRPRLAVRINPANELRGSGMRMGGRASPFGLDVDDVVPLVRRLIAADVDWRGFHIFAGSQALAADAVIETQAATLALVARLSDEIGIAPPIINLGGGFGIPYFAGETPIDIEAVGAALAARLASRPAVLTSSRIAVELGRWLVGEAGVYLARVVDRKTSRGETFLVVDGGMHHQLAATGNLGMVVKRNYPIAIASAAADAPTETVNVVGPLCTPLDRLADRVVLPIAQVGDLIAIFMAGAYGLTASPTAFLGHPAPGQLLVGGGALLARSMP